MAHFAEIDENNRVKRVLVVSNADAVSGQEFLANVLGLGSTWIQTSYNSRGGVHYVPAPILSGGVTIGYGSSASGQPHLRYNYAGIGHHYDPTLDAFYPPKPFNSWVLDTSTCTWKAPVPMPPLTGAYDIYSWNESITAWSLYSYYYAPSASFPN